MALSNLQLWNYLRKTNPNFRSHTAEGTKDLFTEKGFEALKAQDVGALNDFFGLSMRVAFQKLTTARVKNPLADSGLVEVYDTPNGGFIQRMSIDSIKPVTPAFRDLQDGDSPDPFIVRKPTSAERFFAQNFDYQSFISVQDFNVKTIFISEYGMADYVAGIMQGLQNGYTVQNYVNILECLHNGINSANYPLKDTQQIILDSYSAEPTPDELTALILQLKDLATQMETSASTSAFNAMSFETSYNADDFVILMRAGIKNRIQTALMVGAFNPENLTIPFSIKEVENFGGLVPMNGETRLYEVYDKFGAVAGYSATQGADTAEFTPEQVEWLDPNEDILAIVAQKGLIFESIQNPYEVRPIYNPRGLYSNYWASSPNNAISYDPLYACIVIRKPQA